MSVVWNSWRVAGACNIVMLIVPQYFSPISYIGCVNLLRLVLVEDHQRRWFVAILKLAATLI